MTLSITDPDGSPVMFIMWGQFSVLDISVLKTKEMIIYMSKSPMITVVAVVIDDQSVEHAQK